MDVYRWPDHRETLVSMSTPLNTARTARYRIRQNPAAGWAKPFEIIDEQIGGAVCALPDASGYLRELKFRNAKGAREWLALCGETA